MRLVGYLERKQYKNFANTQYIGKLFPVVSHTIIYVESVL
jgi:hypothetical protein